MSFINDGKWPKYLNAGGHCGAVLTDLSKAFDWMNKELFIVKLKLNAYGVEKRLWASDVLIS